MVKKVEYLFQAIKIVAFKDSQNFRQFVFNNLQQRKQLVSLCNWIYNNSNNQLKLIFVYIYGIYSYFCFSLERNKKENSILSVYAYGNELRVINEIQKIVSTSFLIIKKTFKLGLNPYVIFNLFYLLKRKSLYRIIFKTIKKQDFLVSCRVVQTIFLYSRFLHFYNEQKFKVVLVASDSNPYAMAAVFAAKKLNIRTVYVNHGFIPPNPPRLVYDYSILDSKRLYEVYSHHINNKGEILFKGVEGEYREWGKLAKGPKVKIGIFLSLIINWENVWKFINHINKNFPNIEILLRAHPNLLFRDKEQFKKLKTFKNIEISYSKTNAVNDLKKCDFMVAGNSSVHLTALKFSVPSIYFNKMDFMPPDFYLFVKNGLIYNMNSMDEFDIEKVSSFYEKSNWKNIYADYDVSPKEFEEKTKESLVNIFQ
jgi:hypothetical protein